MRGRNVGRYLMIVVLVSGALAIPALRAAAIPPHDPHRILVGFDQSTSPAQRALVHQQAGARVVNTFDWIDVDVVAVPSDLTPLSLIERYAGRAGVRFAEPNWIKFLDSTPNDTYFRDLWGLHNTGQYFGYRSDADIDGPEGWDLAYGSGSFPSTGGLRVGVLDSGIEQTHPDLTDKTKACARATSGSGSVSSGCTDDNGHGTHVAGTIAARTNNGAGVAGVAADAELAVFKAFHANGQAYDTDVIAGMRWLRTTGGARVMNMSFGGPYSSSEASEIASAANAGILLVAAAGNSGTSGTSYPAGYSQVISVAAMDAADRRATFSNYNSDVELIAPGVDILSTYPGSRYVYLDGTSMAAPHVSGVGALVMSAAAIDATTARQLLTSTAVDMGTVGRDVYHGYGRVNLHGALAASPLAPIIQNPAVNALLNTSSVNVSGAGPSGSTIAVKEGGVTLGTTTAGANRTWSIPLNFTEGAHTIEAVSNPGAANERRSTAVSFTIDLTAPPAPTVTSPTEGSVVRGTAVTITGTAEANATVTIMEGSTTLATVVAGANGAWSASPPVTEGSHTVEVRARDRAGNTGAPTARSFSLAIPPPPPTVTSPAESAHIPDGSAVTVAGVALSATSVRIAEGAVELGTATPAADGTWSTVLALSNGPHTLSVTSIDGQGDVSDPTTRTFLVGPAPTVQLTAPAEGSVQPANVPFSGTATPNSKVRIYENGVEITSVTATPSGTFSVSRSMLEGTHRVTATAELVGVTGPATAERSFIVDARPPLVTITTPNNTVIVGGSVNIAGTATDDRALSQVLVRFTNLVTGESFEEAAVCTACSQKAKTGDWSSRPTLRSGAYQVTARSVDGVGLSSTSATIRIVRL